MTTQETKAHDKAQSGPNFCLGRNPNNPALYNRTHAASIQTLEAACLLRLHGSTLVAASLSLSLWYVPSPRPLIRAVSCRRRRCFGD
jgi:hypothetical protein